VQGVTEFLPISSSGHLVLVPVAFGWADQGLIFDVAVHFGSLGAVCIYFRQDIGALLNGGIKVLSGDTESAAARMSLAIAAGTIPAAVAGLLFASWIETHLRRPEVLVITLSAFGILMALADRYGRRDRVMADVRMKDAILIGLAQAMALIAGTSRSGVTITIGRILGLQRKQAARFSFLLSAPVILLASLYKVVSLLIEGTPIAWRELAIGACVSGIVAYLTIEIFMRFVNTMGLLPFAVYRVLLAATILYVLV
jgi:undecaprenyl-diphosphatase